MIQSLIALATLIFILWRIKAWWNVEDEMNSGFWHRLSEMDDDG
jgi:hypothetical protein